MAYRYIGNKTRLLPPLMERIERLVSPGATVADLMCGTAAVSAALRRGGYSVIAGDIMTFAVQHATVRLNFSRAPFFHRLGLTYSEVLHELQSLHAVDDLYLREYSPEGTPQAGCSPRMYVTAPNARHIDAIRLQLSEWESRDLLTNRERCLLRHDLVLAVNRVANIAGTYGHYRSSWSPGALRPLELRKSSFEAGSTDHLVIQGPAEEIAAELSADLCYLDPPYMKRQYAANYHLIETLARGDSPEAIGASGLRDWWDQYSDFCSKRRIADAFAFIFGKMDCPQFLISYSEDGLLQRAELTRIFRDFGRVKCWTIPNQRFRSNGGGAGGSVQEYLFHLELD